MPAPETPLVLPTFGKDPIPGDMPAGKTVRDDPRFSEMRQEIDVLTSIRPDALQPDWPKVAKLGETLLSTLGKDISVASWLAAALLRQRGAEGLAAGAAVLADLCVTYWETLFPPPARLRARIGAIDWWQDQVEAWLDKEKPEVLPAALKTSLDERLKAMDDAIGAAVADNPLRLHVLRSRIARIPSPPEPETPPGPATATAGTNAPAPLASAASGASSMPQASPVTPRFSGDASVAGLLSDSFRFCLDAADALLACDTTQPAAYILRRAALWGGLAKTPPAEGGHTLLAAPEEHVLSSLRALLTSGEHERALREAEAHLNANPFWFDLCRIASEALSALGAAHAVARAALEGETASLAYRFPGLPALTFSDGTPFADAASRQWLSSLGGTSAPVDPFETAVAAAVANPPAQALAALGELLLAHPGGKQTLALYQAGFEVCRKGRLWSPLPFLATRLIALVETHRVSAYDPAAAADALAAAAAALASALRADAGNTTAREHYTRIGAELAGLQPHRLIVDSENY